MPVLRSIRGVIVGNSFKPVREITDRAKRYRARNLEPEGEKRCFSCGRKAPRDIHHISGNEAHGERQNLAWACRSCNVKIANTMRKAGLGKITQQYNPKRTARAHSAKSLGAYLSAVQIVRGDQHGNVSAAVKTLHETTPSQRSAYAKRIWEIRKERYGKTGRTDSLPF